MKKSLFPEKKIIGIINQVENSIGVEICRKHQISTKTFYNWKAKYGGLSVSEAKRLKALEDENLELKQLL